MRSVSGGDGVLNDRQAAVRYLLYLLRPQGEGGGGGAGGGVIDVKRGPGPGR